MNKSITIISLIVIVGFVVLAYFATNKPTVTKFPEAGKVRTAESSDSAHLADRTKGKGKHILVEYSDLQCPACKGFHDYIESQKKSDVGFAKILNEQYTLVYRHFPLVGIHKHAELAAKAAEAAGMQGKFFEFIDAAFSSQAIWAQTDDAKAYFVSIAKNLKLNTEQFTKDLDSPLVMAKVQKDVESGNSIQLNSTPTFLIDGEKITGFGTFEEFKAIILDYANR